MGMIGQALCCWLAADFLSGFWHWLEDRYFDVRWPLIGHHIAKPNELHHAQPNAFLDQGYWSRNSTTIIPAAVAAAAWLWLSLYFPFLRKWTWIFVFASQANEIHAWAHQRCTGWIAVLQQTGLIQSAAHHGRHHRSPFEVRYCVMSDYLNPILDHLRFWRCLELMIGSASGIWPKPPS